MFTYQHKLKLHETDAGGILFFSNQFKIVHDAYECVLENIGFSFAELTKNQNFFLPIVHAEADYTAPLQVGDLIEVTVTTEHVGTSSFVFSYRLTKSDGTLAGTAKTVHVTTDKGTKEKIPLPSALREKIEALYAEDHA